MGRVQGDIDAVGRDRLVCWFSMPRDGGALRYEYFWCNSDEDKNTLGHMFVKVLPQRCQTRKFSDAARVFLSRMQIDSCVVDWTLCSMLGNYPGVDESCARKVDRDLWYDPVFGRSRAMSVLRLFPSLLIYVLREYMVCDVMDQPALRANLDRVHRFSDFAIFTQRVMDFVRSVRWTVDEDDPRHLHPPHNLDLASILSEFHDKGTRLGYQRSRDLFVTVINSFTEVQESSRQCGPVAEEHARCVRDIVRSMEQSIEDPLGVFMIKATKMLPHFDHAGVSALSTAKHEFNECRCGKGRMREKLVRLTQRKPYMMSLVLLFAREWKAHVSVVVYDLPHNFRDRQLSILSEKVGLPHNVVPDSLTRFVFCNSCMAVYSPVNTVFVPPTIMPGGEERAGRVKKSRRQDFSWGFNKVVVDNITKEMYCSNSGSPAHPGCGKVSSILAVGRVIVFKRMVITLCCGKGCGLPMEFSSEHCMFTGDGFLCSTCTYERRNTTPPIPEKRPCFWCGMNTRIMDRVFMYGANTFVCRLHHHKNMPGFVRRRVEAMDRPASEEEVREFVLEFIHMYKERVAKMNKKRYTKRAHRNASRAWTK